jgi:hypothetical protein
MQLMIFDTSRQRRALLRHVLTEEPWVAGVAQADDYQQCLETCALGFRTVVLLAASAEHLQFAQDLSNRRYAVLCVVSPSVARDYRLLPVRVVEYPWRESPGSESQQVEALVPIIVAALKPS